jgi:hypothetical protein
MLAFDLRLMWDAVMVSFVKLGIRLASSFGFLPEIVEEAAL